MKKINIAAFIAGPAKWLLGFLSSQLRGSFMPLSAKRFRIVKILLRQRHPLIAARIVLPGIFIGVVGSIGLLYTMNQSPPRAHAQDSTANIWVDTDGGSCTRSSTPVAYNTASACATMQAAMTAAQGGDKVIVKDGTYPDQTISSGTKASAVSFYAEDYMPATTAAQAYSATTSVYVASLSLSGVDKIHIYGIQATPAPDNSRADARLTYAGGGALNICNTGCGSVTTTDILVDGFHGRNFFGRVTNVVIDHASFGGWDACYDTAGNHLASGVSGTEDGFRFWQGSGGSATPTNSTLRNSVIHDIIMGVNDSEESNVCTYGSTNGPHADCMQNNGGTGIIIENNIFFNCPSSDIQWTPFSSATIGSQTIQNNYFGGIGGPGNGTVLGAQSGSSDDCSNIVVRNNFYNQVGINFHSEGCSGGVGGQIYGNILGDDCWSSQGADFHDNVFETSNTCGTNPRVCTPTFISAPAAVPDWLATSSPDFHLASSDTCAKDKDATTYPATDFEGDARPQGAAADLGPDEYTAPPASANVWVSTTGDDATCARGDATKPCATFLKAYQVAQCGDTVQINNGSYSLMSLGHSGNLGLPSGQNTDAKDCSSTSNPVDFHGQTQSGVVLGGLTIGEPWVSVENITSSSLDIEGWDSTVGCYATPVAYVTVKNSVIDANWAQANPMGMTNVQYVTLSNNSIGNVATGETEIHASGAAGCPDSGHITLSGNTWHDFLNPNGSTDHMECLQIDALISGTVNANYTITGNRFENCGQYDLFTSGSMSDWTITNNYFDAPCSNQSNTGCLAIYTLSLGSASQLVNIVGEYNTVIGYPQFSYPTGATSHSGNVWAYNIDSTGFNWSGQCGSPDGWSLADNLDSNTSSGNGYVCTGDIAGDVTFVSPGPPNYDYDLVAASAGIDELSPCPAGAPFIDIYGTTRPQGSACDIGADEYVVPNPDITAPSVPAGLIKTGTTTNTISMSWNASSDPVVSGDTTSGLAGYNIYRNGTFLTEVVSLTSYTDTGLSSGTTYSYQVSAIDNAGNESSKSSALSASTDPNPPSPPSPPTLKGDCNDDGHVNLTDLSILLSHYDTNYSPADFDTNSLVNLTDLSILLSNYGK